MSDQKLAQVLQVIENRAELHMVVLALADVIVEAGLLHQDSLRDIVEAVVDRRYLK